MLGQTAVTTATRTAVLAAGADFPRVLSLVLVVLVGVGAGSSVIVLASQPPWRGAVVAVVAIAAPAVAGRTASRPSQVVPVVAATLAGVAGLLAADNDKWARLTLAGAGLSACAAVDLLECCVPTPVAHATTAGSLFGLAAWVASNGRWDQFVAAVAATTTVTAVIAALWLAGSVGFGDVRLAAATLTAGTGGLSYVSAMSIVPIAVLGVAGLAQLVVGRHGPMPFGPALVAGWLVAVGAAQ
jgi:leader peptidase (prepilin peptidase)/N-methyltransferase